MRLGRRADHPRRDRPAARANAALNAAARRDRAVRWRPARGALWQVVAPAVPAGGAVLVVGAGNCHDVPLTRLLRRAGRVDLLDVDPAACRAALRGEGRTERRSGRALAGDVALGLADEIVRAAAAGRRIDAAERDRRAAALAAAPLGEPPYDLVVGDLLYSQLLYPGLEEARIADPLLTAVLEEDAPPLLAGVVARLQAAAPAGAVAHVHDALAWWSGQHQPFPIAHALAEAAAGVERGLAAIAAGDGPLGCDPRPALRDLGAGIRATAFWRWPFAEGVDYLVCCTLADGGT